MSDFLSNNAIAGGINYVRDNVSTLLVVTGVEQPTSLAAAAARAIISTPFEPADVSRSNGDVSGLKNTMGAQTGLAATAAGNSDWVIYASASEMLVGYDMSLPGRVRVTDIAVDQLFNVSAATDEARDLS